MGYIEGKFSLCRSLVLSFVLLTVLFLSLFRITYAASPEMPINPEDLAPVNSLIITSTKRATPNNIVLPGEILTYTIVFTSDSDTGTVVITDPIPSETTYLPGTISGTATPGVSVIHDDTGLGSTLAWTATGVVTDSVVTLTFAVTVSSSIGGDTVIKNTAWLSTANETFTATANVTAGPIRVFLPIVVKPPYTRILINATNTGGITSLEIGPYSCPNVPIPDNTPTHWCGVDFPAGTYDIVAKTNRCGTLQGTLTLVVPEDTINVLCY